MARLNKSKESTKKEDNLTEDIEKDEGSIKPKVESKSTIKKELKKIAKDVDVEVVNLTNGTLIYQCSKTNETLLLDSTGDSSIVSLEFLLNMKNKGLLENLSVSIIDIYEDDYTVKDVLSLLGLEKLYKECDMTLDKLDTLIEGSSNQKFESIIEKADIKVIERITERAVILSKNGGFDSNYKRNILEEKMNNRYLFSSI